MAGQAKMTVELSPTDRRLLRQIRDALLAAGVDDEVDDDGGQAVLIARRLMEPDAALIDHVPHVVD